MSGALNMRGTFLVFGILGHNFDLKTLGDVDDDIKFNHVH
jgi:hypothetical protein